MTIREEPQNAWMDWNEKTCWLTAADGFSESLPFMSVEQAAIREEHRSVVQEQSNASELTENYDRSSAIAHFFVLGTAELYHALRCRVGHVHLFEQKCVPSTTQR